MIGRRVAVSAVLAAGAALAAGPSGVAGPLTAGQRARLGKLAGELAAAEAMSDAWYAAAEGLLELGDAGRARLAPAVERLFRGQRREYAAAVLHAARDLQRKRFAERMRRPGVGKRGLELQVRKDRAAVIGLVSAGAGLTKDAIVSTGDPAMKRLAELLTVAPAEVLSAEGELKPRRAKLLRLWGLRDRCVGADGDKPSWTPEQSVTAVEELFCLLAVPVAAPGGRVLQHNAKVGERLAYEEAAGIRDLNRIRLLLGLGAVAADLRLCEAARDHSADMAERGFFSHDSPVPGKETPWKRARRAGTTASAENIASGAKTGPAANRQWFHSPGHFRNMLGRHRRVGLGRSGRHWTQLFGR